MMSVHVICVCSDSLFFFFFFKQKTAYEMRISDWSSDVCSSDLLGYADGGGGGDRGQSCAGGKSRWRTGARGGQASVRLFHRSGARRGSQDDLCDRILKLRRACRHPSSEERRVGKEGGSACQFRGARYQQQNKHQ